MNKEKIIIANWKMNFLYNDASNFCKKILLKKKKIINKLVICPPFPIIYHLSKKFKNIDFGGQDCHFERFGAFTGDISPLMLKNIGCKYVIIGHSERRENHFETNHIIKKKIVNAIKFGLIPIFCIGENSRIKRLGKTKNFLLKQIKDSLPKKITKKIIIAYEPVWAIGTGKTPNPDEISNINIYIKKLLTRINMSYKSTKIIYGGSVDIKNSKVFLKNVNIDGLLLGGNSLKFNAFISILTC